MKKLTYIIILLSTMALSCGDNSTKTDVAYTDPGFDSKENVKDTKQANFANMPTQNSSGASCNAIIFQKNIDGKDYVAIGYKKNSFYLKIYWEDSSIPSSVDTPNFNININGSTSTSDSLKLTAQPQSDGTYLITFTGDISVGAYTIASGDTIRAAKY